MTGSLTPKMSDIPKQPWYVKYFIYILITCGVLAATYSVGYLMPFEPFTFYSYTNLPDEVCPGEKVQVRYNAKVEDKWYYSVGDKQGSGYWLTESGMPFGSEPVDAEIQPYNDRNVVSPIIRIAPTGPGEYRIGADIAITGRMFYIVPVRQPKASNTVIQSEKTITVLPLTADRCAVRLLGKGVGQ